MAAARMVRILGDDERRLAVLTALYGAVQFTGWEGMPATTPAEVGQWFEAWSILMQRDERPPRSSITKPSETAVARWVTTSDTSS